MLTMKIQKSHLKEIFKMNRFKEYKLMCVNAEEYEKNGTEKSIKINELKKDIA